MQADKRRKDYKIYKLCKETAYSCEIVKEKIKNKKHLAPV